MSTNNTVTAVMFLKGAAIKPATAITPDALANGAWGVFDYDTGLSVDATATLPARFFFAEKDADGKITTSAGTHVQTKNVKSMSNKAGANAKAQEILFENAVVESGPDATHYDYGFRLDFRGNTEVYQRFGANQATKFFTANTRCVGSAGASVDAASEVAAQLVEGIIADTDKFIGVKVHMPGSGSVPAVNITFDPANPWDDTTTTTNLEAIRNFTGSGMTFTVIIHPFSEMLDFCGINPKYFKQRQIKGIVSLIDGDCIWVSFKDSVDMDYGTGFGYDIQELEYIAGGFNANPGPYRQSRLNGLPFSHTAFRAVKKTRYNVVTMEYDQFSVGGWLEYLNNLTTYFVMEDKAASTAMQTIAGTLGVKFHYDAPTAPITT